MAITDDLKVIITAASGEEIFQIVRESRANRRKKPPAKVKAKGSRTINIAKVAEGISPEMARRLLEKYGG